LISLEADHFVHYELGVVHATTRLEYWQASPEARSQSYLKSTKTKYLFLLTAPASSSACEVRFFVADILELAIFSEDNLETSASTSAWPAATEF